MSEAPTRSARASTASALALMTLLFFMWGFITVLNDILIPHLKGLFALSNFEAMLVQLAFFGAYFTVSLPAGWLIGQLGYRAGIVLGLGLAAAGAALFYPAAALSSYAAFLLALFVLAAGITVLQVAANPYVTELGPPQTAASRLNLAQGLNSLGTTLAPLFGAALILRPAAGASPQASAATVQGPYLGIAATLAALALVFALVRLPRPRPPAEPIDAPAGAAAAVTDAASLWRHAPLRWGAPAIFLYVGAEVSIGSLLVLYFGQPDTLALPEAEAGYYVSLYWGAAMVGRFLGAAAQRRVAPARTLMFAAALAAALVLTSTTQAGALAAAAILAVGLANSIMFPTIFSLSVAGLGARTSRGSGILVMAIVGGALVPAALGELADLAGYRVALAGTLLCYGYIFLFARRARAWRVDASAERPRP